MRQRAAPSSACSDESVDAGPPLRFAPNSSTLRATRHLWFNEGRLVAIEVLNSGPLTLEARLWLEPVGSDDPSDRAVRPHSGTSDRSVRPRDLIEMPGFTAEVLFRISTAMKFGVQATLPSEPRQ